MVVSFSRDAAVQVMETQLASKGVKFGEKSAVWQH